MKAGDEALSSESIARLLENIKSTVVESFEKLDNDIKECKKDIKDVKEKLQHRENADICRLSVIGRSR